MIFLEVGKSNPDGLKVERVTWSERDGQKHRRRQQSRRKSDPRIRRADRQEPQPLPPARRRPASPPAHARPSHEFPDAERPASSTASTPPQPGQVAGRQGPTPASAIGMQRRRIRGLSKAANKKNTPPIRGGGRGQSGRRAGKSASLSVKSSSTARSRPLLSFASFPSLSASPH